MAATAERVTLTREIEGIGRLDFEQTDKRRDYWLLPEGGTRRIRLPSVTTIIRDTWPKPELLEWYAREGNASAILAAAAERGKLVHHFVETWANGEIPSLADLSPEDCRPYLRAPPGSSSRSTPQIVASERLICHPEQRYAGRLRPARGPGRARRR